ncbi:MULTISPECIES: PRC-barrel domain-containing protein [Actinomycetes]|uniref:PRC-barrel domain-containing protein n=1 Tax=Actinomycetes TaxID=1760 RepID=UPI0012DD880F|nr:MULTISPECIES: PRC-barrel domain-containing protein [Actinomycetes]
MTISSDQVSSLSRGGGKVMSARGGKIGSIGQIYLDNQTDEPTWVTVKTGLFGASESFAPLADATVQGNNIAINYNKAKIKDAPRVDPDGSLSPAEEDRLYEYYGIAGTGCEAEAAGDTGEFDEDGNRP